MVVPFALNFSNMLMVGRFADVPGVSPSYFFSPLDTVLTGWANAHTHNSCAVGFSAVLFALKVVTTHYSTSPYSHVQTHPLCSFASDVLLLFSLLTTRSHFTSRLAWVWRSENKQERNNQRDESTKSKAFPSPLLSVEELSLKCCA